MDYTRKIAPDTAAFIARSEAISAADTDGVSMTAQRQNYAALCDHFARPHPPGVRVENTTMGGVAVRIYRPQNSASEDSSPENSNPEDSTRARMLYFHGGGFIVGDLDTHDSICADLAAATGGVVIATDYRLAPEHRHPAGLDDCRAVSDALLAQENSPLILVGDSAGGWLAAMVATMMAGDNPAMIKGQVLIYPVLGAPLNSESYRRHADAPLLPGEAIGWYWEQYLGAKPAPDEPLPPLAYECLSGQPPTRIIAAELDPLIDDSMLYAERLASAGGDVGCVIAKGLPHGFLRARHITEAGGKAWQDIIAFCRDLA